MLERGVRNSWETWETKSVFILEISFSRVRSWSTVTMPQNWSELSMTQDMVTEKVGELLVTEVRDRVAIGAYNGAVKPEVGYLAKKVQK